MYANQDTSPAVWLLHLDAAHLTLTLAVRQNENSLEPGRNISAVVQGYKYKRALTIIEEVSTKRSYPNGYPLTAPSAIPSIINFWKKA